jgi:hypothetical protein
VAGGFLDVGQLFVVGGGVGLVLVFLTDIAMILVLLVVGKVDCSFFGP